MDKQMLLVCNKKGKFSGKYISKDQAHQGKGVTHLAIAVLLYNKRGEVLFQRRKHQLFDNLWDLTGATHLLHLPSGHDETFEEAALRCLKREYDIEGVGVKKVGAFYYFARDNEQKRIRGRKTNDTHFAQDDKKAENEYCVLFVGEYGGKVKLNHGVGHEYQWMDREEFLKDISQNPKKYSPWAKEAVKLVYFYPRVL